MRQAAGQEAALPDNLLHKDAQVQGEGLVVAHQQHGPVIGHARQAALRAAVLRCGEEHRADQAPYEGRVRPVRRQHQCSETEGQRLMGREVNTRLTRHRMKTDYDLRTGSAGVRDSDRAGRGEKGTG